MEVPVRRTIALVSTLVLVLALLPPVVLGDSGFGAAGPAPGLRIGLVTDPGGRADGGFNEYAWAGVEAGAKALHGSAAFIATPGNESGYAWGIDWFADHGYDVIVTVGFLMSNVTLAEAANHPGIQFLGIDQPITGAAPSNYQRLMFDEAEPGYLAGIAAAMMTKTNTIGAVGGADDVSPVLNFINGFRNGAASVNPDISVLVGYAGDFARPDLGTEVADGLTAQNADVIFAVAGGTNLGVFGAACEGGIWAIGVDVDEYLKTPAFQSCILTSAEKRIALATSLAIQRFAADGLQAGEYLNDASSGGIGLAPIRNTVMPKGLKGALDTALVGLANGTVDPCSPTACTTP
jgi:basic membrane protein A